MKETGILSDDMYIIEGSSIQEEDGSKKYYLKGEFGRVNTKNKNGRIYPKNVMESALKESKELLESRGMVGELGHPPTPQINYENATHVMTKLEINEDGRVYGEAEVLDPKRFPKANIVVGLIENKIKFGVSSRGYGKVLRNGELMEVAPGYKLVTWDIVQEPSSFNAFPEPVYEDVEIDKLTKIKDILNEMFKKTDN